MLLIGSQLNLHLSTWQATSLTTKHEPTKSLVASQGKAMYLGEQMVGKPDSGAYVMMLLFDSLYDEAKRCID